MRIREIWFEILGARFLGFRGKDRSYHGVRMILIKIAVLACEIESMFMGHTCKFSPTYGKSTLEVIPCCLRRVAFPIPGYGILYFLHTYKRQFQRSHT